MRRLIGALVVVVLGACSPEVASTGSPSAGTAAPATVAPGSVAPESGTPSLAPSAEPSSGASPAALGLIPPGSAIEVRIAELNLREGPNTSSARIEILERGQVLIVSPYDNIWFGAGPVQGNGYTWYPVMKLQNADPSGNLPALPGRPILIGTEIEVGWVATDNGETSYVTPVAPRCPTTVDLTNVEAMLSAERLACFEGPIVLEGTYGCPGCGAGGVGDFEPMWLSDLVSLDLLSVDVPEQLGPVALRFPPDGPDRPAQGARIRVTVHLDDPAAAGCSMTIRDQAPVPPATAVEYCRQQLVVESYAVLGMDPDFGA